MTGRRSVKRPSAPRVSVRVRPSCSTRDARAPMHRSTARARCLRSPAAAPDRRPSFRRGRCTRAARSRRSPAGAGPLRYRQAASSATQRRACRGSPGAPQMRRLDGRPDDGSQQRDAASTARSETQRADRRLHSGGRVGEHARADWRLRRQRFARELVGGDQQIARSRAAHARARARSSARDVALQRQAPIAAASNAPATGDTAATARPQATASASASTRARRIADAIASATRRSGPRSGDTRVLLVPVTRDFGRPRAADPHLDRHQAQRRQPQPAPIVLDRRCRAAATVTGAGGRDHRCSTASAIGTTSAR